TVISTLNSLTLSPALAALLLKPEHATPDFLQRAIDRVLASPFRLFNRTFERGSGGYGRLVRRLSGLRALVLLVFAGLLACTWGVFQRVPGGFIPAQDKQYLIAIAQLPDAASLDRTEAVVGKMSDIALATPGVIHTIGFPGLSINGFVNL